MRMERVSWRDTTCALQTPCHACTRCLFATQGKCVRKNVRARRSVYTSWSCDGQMGTGATSPWRWDRRKDRSSGWNGWEREVVLVVSVRCGKEWDMTRGRQLFWRHNDVQSWALQLLSHACSRDAMWSSCATLYVLCLWMCCSHLPSVGWRFFSRQPKPVLTLRKKSSNGFDPNAMTMTKLSAGFTATPCRTSNLFFGSTAQSYFSLPSNCCPVRCLTGGSIFFLGPCQVLVAQSFAFSFRLSKVSSLIEWLLTSFCIYRENPMHRILNSCSSCGDVDVPLQGDSVVQHHVPCFCWRAFFMVVHSLSFTRRRSTSWPCSRVLYPAARLQKEVLLILCHPRCCYKFPRNFSNRLMVPKMILRLGFVDLVNRIASSNLVRHVALSELSEPSGRAHPVFSYIPLSQYKLQDDSVWLCLIKLQAFLLSELQIAPKYSILTPFSNILVWRDPWFRQIAWSFSHTISIIHRVHCSEEHRLSSSLEAFSSWN